MTLVAVVVVALVVVVSLIVFAGLIQRAPFGWEDERGFHEGEPR